MSVIKDWSDIMMSVVCGSMTRWSLRCRQIFTYSVVFAQNYPACCGRVCLVLYDTRTRLARGWHACLFLSVTGTYARILSIFDSFFLAEICKGRAHENHNLHRVVTVCPYWIASTLAVWFAFRRP